MSLPSNKPAELNRRFSLPRNVWAVSLTSLLMDISSEMVLNILPLYLSNVLGVRTSIIGVIEGLAETIASLLKLLSGWFSDLTGQRKWLAVVGYGLSALVKPFFYFANSWVVVASVRWIDRVGKGIRTAPRDALVADSAELDRRGLAFGFHRAADTAGAVIGLLIALILVWKFQAGSVQLNKETFQVIVLASLLPAFLAVLVLALGAKDVTIEGKRSMPRLEFRTLGKPFLILMLIVGIFELGNSSDAFLVLRAQERGLSVTGILSMLIAFNVIYSLLSTPAGRLSDQIGRRRLIVAGWLVYAFIYLGFALAHTGIQIWLLYACYGIYYGLAYGTTKALVADLVPVALRGTAYGTYNALLGILDFPASVIAGVLWQGIGNWAGFGPAAPFIFSAAMAFIATMLLAAWLPATPSDAATIPSS